MIRKIFALAIHSDLNLITKTLMSATKFRHFLTEDPDQLKNGMWPYESVTKILPDEAIKNVTDLKLPPSPAPQPFIPAKEPNQALQSPSSGANNNTSSNEKAKNGTTESTAATNGTKNGTSTAANTSGDKSATSGSNANKTEDSKIDNKVSTASLNSTSNTPKENATNAKTENTSDKNSSQSKVEQNGNKNNTKIEQNNEGQQNQNKEGKVEEINKANDTTKMPSEMSGTGVGKLVDPARPTNDSVVPSAEATPPLGPKESQKPEQNAAQNKAPEKSLAKVNEYTSVPNGVSQETEAIKKPEEDINRINKPITAGSTVAQEKPNQGDASTQQKPAQSIETAKMKKPELSSPVAQSTPVPNEQMAQSKPVEINPQMTKPLTNDQLAQNKPAINNDLAQSTPVPNEQQAQTKPSPGGTVAQSNLGQNAKVQQNNPVTSNEMVKNKPAEGTVVEQSRPIKDAGIAQSKPAESAVVAQKKPVDGANMAQNKLVEPAIVAQNKPVENAVMVQKKPVDGANTAQNKLVEPAIVAQNKPVDGANMAQNKLLEPAIVAQNQPAGVSMGQNRPAETNVVTQKKPAPAKNTAEVNKVPGDDLSSDLFGDDAAPINTSPNKNQQANNQQGQVVIGNGLPANGVGELGNPETQIPMIQEQAAEGPGPLATQNSPLTHEKMIELSSPPITNIGHTNFATEKNLHLPFTNAKTEGVKRPEKNIVNQFIGNGGIPGPTAKPMTGKPITATPITAKLTNAKPTKARASKAEGLASIFPTANPVLPTDASIVKGVTPLKPTLAKKKTPETLEEFETERLKKQGLASTMDEGLLKSYEGKPRVEKVEGNSSLWIDDFGLLGDAPWVRDKAPDVPKSSDKGESKDEVKEKKNEETKESEKDEKRKKDENKKETKNDKEKGSDKEGKSKSADEGKEKLEKIEEKLEHGNRTRNNKTENTEEKTERNNEKEKNKKDESKSNESKEKDTKEVKEKEDSTKADENNMNVNNTDNVVNSKVSYKYIENRTNNLDNSEYHAALNKNNGTNQNENKPSKTNSDQEPIQAQNIIQDQTKDKSQGLFPAAKQNALPVSTNLPNSQTLPSTPQMTSAGDIHQISSAQPIGSALPLAAMPVSNPDHPQFFVSSPVSNQSTTTTTGLVPVDPNTGDHVFNTSLALVAVHGDEGAIPESTFVGSDQVDWMKKNVPSKKDMAMEMKNFLSGPKVSEKMEYSIDDVGKRKSEVRPKSIVPVISKENRKMEDKKIVNSIKRFAESRKRKRNTFSKLQKALEGTNVTIENGVASHMTFKSFVPRLSFDDIIDEQKRSAIPNSKKRQDKGDEKRSWEKNLGNVIGALDGTNFSIQNGVASHLTFKSNIEPVTLIKTKKLQKSLNDIENEGGSKAASQGDKGQDMKADVESMERKGDKMKIKNGSKIKNEKLIGKKKPERVPYKARKSTQRVKLNGKVSQRVKRPANEGKQNLMIEAMSIKKNSGKNNKQSVTKNDVKRSKTGNYQFHNKIGSHRVPLKGANHSEANLVSMFSGTKDAKEAKSVTITNVNKAVVDNGASENGTLKVETKEEGKKNDTDVEKEKGKAGLVENKAKKNGTAVEIGNSNKTAGNDTAERGKNSTAQKPPERGVFEPDIGTMKKMPETTDIKHHIIGTGDTSNHTSVGSESNETLVLSNVIEHKVTGNNTLHAIYNLRRINEENNENTTNMLLKNIDSYSINENNTLRVVYNVKPHESNAMNSTSKELVSNVEEHHTDNDKVLNAAQNPQGAQKKGNIDGGRGHVKKVIAGERKQHKNESKNWNSQKQTTKAGKLNAEATAGSGFHEKGTGKNKKRKKLGSSKTEKHQIVKRKSKKESNGEDKDENLAKKIRKVEGKSKKKHDDLKKRLKKTSKDNMKGFESSNTKSSSEDSVQVAIKGKLKNTKPKKLKRIGLVLPQEDRKIGKSKHENVKKARKKLKNKGVDIENGEKDATETKGTKVTQRKDKGNERHDENKYLQKDVDKESKAKSKKIKSVKNGAGKVGKLAKNKAMKKKMESRVKKEKKDRKKAVKQMNKIMKKIMKIATGPTRNPVEKQKDSKKSKKEKGRGKLKKVQNDEERLKDIEKRKRVRTIFFPQIFMKRTSVPKSPGRRVTKAKGRQLIPTQVGNLDPSNGAAQNAVAGQEDSTKNSDKPSTDKENGNKTATGSALYENNRTIDGMKNNGSNNGTGDQGSKNSLDTTTDIDKVLNLTVGFLNKTFHDHFGKAAHEKDKVNGTNDKVGQDVTSNLNNSTQNGTSNSDMKNGTTSNGISNFDGAKNETKNINSTGTNASNLSGNSSSLQNSTGTTNLTTGNFDSNKQNSTNQIGNNTIENQSKQLNVSGGFRSERIPGISKAAAVSDMMSPIENYILNMINETGQEKFGNQSTPEGKRGSSSSSETNATGVNGLAALLSKAKGNLNLKSNEVNIKITPKRNTNSAGTSTVVKTGAGMMLNFASKRSKVKNIKKKGKPQGNLKGKKTKPTKASKAMSKSLSKSPNDGLTVARRNQKKHQKPTAKKIQKKATAKSGIKLATTHKIQRVTTFAKGPATLGFTKEIVSTKKPSKSVKETKGVLKKDAKLKEKLLKPNSKVNAGEKSKTASKQQNKTKNEKKKDTKKSKRIKRQEEKQNSNQNTNENEGNFPIRIGGQKIDWGPLSENWPNYGTG